jgi:hypothetical protein
VYPMPPQAGRMFELKKPCQDLAVPLLLPQKEL